MFESFTYMFKDASFIKKYLLVLLFVTIANLFMNWSGIYAPVLNDGQTSILYYLLYIIGYVIMFVPFGYSIGVLRHTLTDSENDDLPNVSVLKNFLAGLKVILSGAVLIIALFVVFTVLGFINAMLPASFGDVTTSVIFVLSLLILFFTSFFGIAMCSRYVVKPSYLNFVNFKACIGVIENNILRYSKAYLKTALLAIVVYGLSIIFVSFLVKLSYTGLVIYSILVSLMWTYVLFVLAKIFAKAVDVEKL